MTRPIPPARPGLAVTFDGATAVVPIRGKPRRILDDVSLYLRPGEFVGVIGASGSGKSTLIKALTGQMPLEAGTVSVDGRPCSPDELCTDRRIGYLPQEVIVHELLTPIVALTAVARFKRPGDPDPAAAATAALARVGMADRADVVFERLSGGQKKRVGLAAELLGDPGVILLDEATSGLDPASEAEMMELFRSLAGEGRTVVCVTHFPDRLHRCHRLVVMAAGRMVYTGPPGEAARFFGAATLEEVYGRVADRPAAYWADRLATQHPDRLLVPPPWADAAAARAPALAPVRQLAVLTARYARLQLADFRAILLQFAQAPVIGLMVAATFGDIARGSYDKQGAADAKQVLFVLVLAMLWCAGSASAREVVKELDIVRHERRFGLDVAAYLLSKFGLLAAVCVVQALLLLFAVRAGTNLPGPAAAQCLIAAGTAVAGVALGLCVSAAAGTSERAMTVLPVWLIGLAVFSGGLARLTGKPLWLARASSPAYWALDGLRAPLAYDLRTATYEAAPGYPQQPILGSGGPLSLDLLALALQAGALMAVAAVALRRRV